MVYRRVVLALLLVLSILVGGYGLAVNVSPIAPELYESEFSGNITGFRAEGYVAPLVLLVNGGGYGVKVLGEAGNTTRVSVVDVGNGSYVFSNVVSLSIVFGEESLYYLADDYIRITVSNGLSNITVYVDETGGSEENGPGVADNYYDDLRIVVDGETLYSLSDRWISIPEFRSVVDNGGRKYLRITIAYWSVNTWSYKVFLLELPGLWNITFYRKGYELQGSYEPTWLPDITVEEAAGTLSYVYMKKDGGVWRTVYTGSPAPIVYNGTNIYIDTGIPVPLYENISVTSIYANQPIWIEYENGTAVNTTIPGHKDSLDIGIAVDKIEKMIDGKYHYILRIIIPYNSSALLRFYTRGKIKIEGYGEYEDIAEILVGYNASLSSDRLEPTYGIPIAYAADEGVVLDITSDSTVNASIVKVITENGEYMVNQTITLSGQAISYVQSLYNKYGLLLVAVPIIFILLILLALAAGRRRR